MARHAQNLCDNLKKNWGMKLNFCENEYQSFLQINTIIFDEHGPGMPKVLKLQDAVFLQYLKKELL